MSDSEENFSDNKRRRDESNDAFHKSKKVYRTPNKNEKGLNGLAEMKEMMEKMMEQMKTNQQEVIEKMKENQTEMRALRKEMKETNERWEQKYKQLENRLLETEKRLETLESEKRKTNIVVTGIQMNENINQGDMIQVVKTKLKQLIKIECNIQGAIKLGRNRVLIKMESFEEKLQLLKNKNLLKGTQIYIDSDLTPQEREIQSKLREIMRTKKAEGQTVKMGHQKIIINGKEMVWDKTENQLKERKNGKKLNSKN